MIPISNVLCDTNNKGSLFTPIMRMPNVTPIIRTPNVIPMKRIFNVKLFVTRPNVTQIVRIPNVILIMAILKVDATYDNTLSNTNYDDAYYDPTRKSYVTPIMGMSCVTSDCLM